MVYPALLATLNACGAGLPPLTQFDVIPCGQCFGHTFDKCWADSCVVTGALVQMRLRAGKRDSMPAQILRCDATVTATERRTRDQMIGSAGDSSTPSRRTRGGLDDPDFMRSRNHCVFPAGQCETRNHVNSRMPKA